jgi:hypothetical protein
MRMKDYERGAEIIRTYVGAGFFTTHVILAVEGAFVKLFREDPAHHNFDVEKFRKSCRQGNNLPY